MSVENMSPTQMSPQESDLDVLRSNLYLLASDHADLKAYLEGYSDFGIYQECLQAVRQSMAELPCLIRSGKLSLDTIASLVECYHLIESLARHPAASNSEQAFRSDPHWRKAKQLARQVADRL